MNSFKLIEMQGAWPMIKMSMTKNWIFAIGVAVGTLAASAASAQTYPNKPVRFISPYTPGGAADIGIRYLGLKLQEAGWPTAIIENRPGGGGAVAALAALQGAPDGYTIFQCDWPRWAATSR